MKNSHPQIPYLQDVIKSHLKQYENAKYRKSGKDLLPRERMPTSKWMDTQLHSHQGYEIKKEPPFHQ